MGFTQVLIVRRGFILAFPFRGRAFKETLLDEIYKACPFKAKKKFFIKKI